MRIAVVADVHSNLPAFETVLAHAAEEAPFDAIWSLGDLVGYGPEPGACIALLRRYPHVAVAGNHDRAAAGLMTTDEFNPVAAAAAQWTATVLTGAERAYLRGLPEVAVEGEFTLVHGSLRDPVWEYLLSPDAAAAHFALQATPYSFVGHSHLQFTFEERAGRPPEGLARLDLMTVDLDATRLIANPGGLGQPRDGDPRTAYILLDTESRSLTFHRIEYDIGRTQERMREAGLPVSLIERLSRGR